MTEYDKPIAYHDWYLAENTEPLSLHHNDIAPSVNPVSSVRDILKGDTNHGQNYRRFSGNAQGRPETDSQESGPLPDPVKLFPLCLSWRSDSRKFRWYQPLSDNYVSN